MYNGQKIKDLIEKRGLKLNEVYTSIGMKEGTFFSIISEKGNPKADKLELIADYLLCPIDTFFDRTEVSVSVNIGHKVNGNGNKISGDISLSECKKENEHLKQLIQEKERIINEKERTIQILMKD